MNWEDERWVRMYTRRTLNMKLVGWEGRTVLWHLMCEVDRSGVLDIGSTPPVDAVAAVCDLPMDLATKGLEALIAKKTVVVNDGRLLIANFLEAQECRMSDRARQRKVREMRRDSVTNCDAKSRSVTGESRSVTNSHTASHAVTARHTVSPQDKTRQDKTRQDDPPCSPPLGDEFALVPETSNPGGKRKATADQIRQVFDHWVQRTGRTGAVRLDSNRERCIRRGIERYSVDECLEAINGCRLSAHHRGENEAGKRYDDITLILRNSEKLEGFRDDWRNRDKPKTQPTTRVGGLPHVSKSDDRIVVARDEGTPTKQLSADEMRKAWRGGGA